MFLFVSAAAEFIHESLEARRIQRLAGFRSRSHTSSTRCSTRTSWSSLIFATFVAVPGAQFVDCSSPIEQAAVSGVEVNCLWILAIEANEDAEVQVVEPPGGYIVYS